MGSMLQKDAAHYVRVRVPQLERRLRPRVKVLQAREAALETLEFAIGLHSALGPRDRPELIQGLKKQGRCVLDKGRQRQLCFPGGHLPHPSQAIGKRAWWQVPSKRCIETHGSDPLRALPRHPWNTACGMFDS